MISVIIPTYKNKEQFLANLQHNWQYLQDCEVIVVNDDPTESIQEDLKSFIGINLIENPENYGFGKTVNIGVQQATQNYLFLLNNDVVLLDDSFKTAIKHFDTDSSIFAVSFAQKEKDGSIVGKNRIFWKNGFIHHSKADDLNFGVNAWAEGGASIFDKAKFLELNGFDDIYLPFYWEDIDLSYRAWKHGFKVLFEPAVVVEHHHTSTISKYYQDTFKNIVSSRNQFLFIWKNIQNPNLWREHIFLLIPNFIYLAMKGSAFFLKGFAEAYNKRFLIKADFAKNVLDDTEVLETVSST